MYGKKFEIRWSDLDANRHLGNSAYLNFMSHTRMSFLTEKGFDHRGMEKYQIGPGVFHEHVYYFREILPGTTVLVTLELKGLSQDGMYFEFLHNFYDSMGQNCASCEVMGGWIDLKTRKLTGLPSELVQVLNTLNHHDSFRVLTSEDTRKYGRRPLDKDPAELS